MANVENLNQQILKKLGNELEKNIRSGFSPEPVLLSPGSEVEEYQLGNYYFPVWSLSPVHLAGKPDHILKKARKTGRWYHPLVRQKDIVAFAVCHYSRIRRKWRVLHVEGPQIADELDRAVDLVEDLDEYREDVIRFLEIPCFYILALWIAGTADKIVLVDFPGSIKALNHRTVYPAADFFGKLPAVK